jgi:hypothetical protein
MPGQTAPTWLPGGRTRQPRADGCRSFAVGRHLRLGWLQQFARPQIHPRRQALDVMGRAGNRRGRVQRRPQPAATPTPGSMSPIARTTACRCSKGSGRTCTALRSLYAVWPSADFYARSQPGRRSQAFKKPLPCESSPRFRQPELTSNGL